MNAAMNMEVLLLAWLGALLMGLGKGGLPGVGNLTVVIFASIFDPKASVGLLLPVLISADIVAITLYRRHAQWSYVWRLLPWMCAGTVLGYFAFGVMNSNHVKVLIGATVLGMTALQIVRTVLKRYRAADAGDNVPHSLPFRAGMGLLGGFATMVANAAGPVAQLYFLAVGLPKMAFIGTGAWCFFLINVFKVPFQVELGIINFSSIQLSLAIAPAAMIGALLAPRIVRFIPQRLFEWLIWVFIVVAGVKMIFF